MFISRKIQIKMLPALFLLLAACSSGADVQPTEELAVPADWEKFEAGEFSLYLPESFAGGSTAEELAAVVQVFQDAGQESLAEDVETRPSSSVFFGVDANIVDPARVETKVTIFHDQATQFSEWSLEDYVNWYASILKQGDDYTELDSRNIVIDGIAAHVQVGEYDFGTGSPVVAEEYAIKIGDTVWSIIYSTDSSEYEARKGDFEISALSFNLN